jgi:integrase
MHRGLIDRNEPVTIENLKDSLRGAPEKTRQILEVFKHHNDQVAQLVGKEYSKVTLTRYKTALEHTRSFLEWKFGIPDMAITKLNAYLKEIADVCGIQKILTFHIARNTFATTVTLSNGVPIESVSKMLGHKNLRTTQHYAKILDSKVSADLKALKGRLAGLGTLGLADS